MKSLIPISFFFLSGYLFAQTPDELIQVARSTDSAYRTQMLETSWAEVDSAGAFCDQWLINARLFSQSDFSDELVGNMLSTLQYSYSCRAEMILFLGTMKNEQVAGLLRQYGYAARSNFNQTEKFYLLLALARIGDATAISVLRRRIEGLEINDDVIYEIFPHLPYTQNRTLFQILINATLADNVNCSMPDPENEGMINCAYRVMELIAPYIVDFPYSVDASGDLQVRDYGKALDRSRKWLNANPDFKLVWYQE